MFNKKEWAKQWYKIHKKTVLQQSTKWQLNNPAKSNEIKRKWIKKNWMADNYIKAALRRIWIWSPKRKICLQNDYCACCKKKSKKLFADHKLPVVDTRTGFVDWNTYIYRMFEGELQALCKKCHKIKSKEENRQRRETKEEKLNGNQISESKS